MPATTRCPGCDAHLPAANRWDTCPRCKAALPRQAPAPATTTKYHTAATGPRSWSAPLLCLGLLIVVVLLGYRLIVPSTEQLHHRQVSRALAACQMAVRAASPAGSETPPHARNFGASTEFYFAWPRGAFSGPDPSGRIVPMSASCIGSLDSGTITQMTVNGQDIH